MTNPIPANMAEALWSTAKAQPGDALALHERDHKVTYRSLLGRAAGVGRTLCDQGVGPGDRVAIFMSRGTDAIAAYYGVLSAGAAPVIVNETLRARQIEYILRHSSSRAFLAEEALLKRQPRAIDMDAACAQFTAEDFPDEADWEPRSRVAGDLAQIIYTSGSTGQPKGVALSHGNLWAGVHSVSRYVELTAADRIASLLPFSFDYGLNQLLCAIHVGGSLVIERSPLPPQIVRTLRELEVSVLPVVPPLWHQLLNVSDFTARPLPSLRAMTNTGGHLPETAVRALRESQPQAKLILMYGLTEAFRSTYLPPEETDRRPGSIGRAIPGAQIMVLRDDGTECEPDEPGELVHRGPTVALGYWNDPDATAKRFRPNPRRPQGTPDSERVVFSGDLVKRDAEGFLYFVSRGDRMIKTLGFRVSPDEVVSALHASGHIVEVVVAGEEDEARGGRIVAYVVLKETCSLEELEAFARAELPRYMQPARYEVRDSLPRTASGKHDILAAQSGGESS